MLVVPVAKDIIHTKDGQKYKVIEYTNYKEAGPAVYARSIPNKDMTLIYFFDIDVINKTKVEYQKSSRVFMALGKIHREQHLPQPDDKVVVRNIESKEEEFSRIRIDVKGLKLKNRTLGYNKGMSLKGDNNEYYRIKHIIDIDRALGGDGFSREAFMAYYKDYIGV